MIRNRRRLVNNLGYVLYWKPEHPRSESKGAYAGYVYEHVVVAEKIIRRFLEDDEVVHQMDFISLRPCRRNLSRRFKLI